MDLLDRLTKHSWEVKDGKKMLFLEERYFVFDEDDNLFDGGSIIYDDAQSTITLTNDTARGVLKVIPQGQDLLIDGELFTEFGGGVSMQAVMQKSDLTLELPKAEDSFEAVIMGDIEMLQANLEHEDINQRDIDGTTLLMDACHIVSKELISYLLEQGIELNAVDDDGQNALHHAVWAHSLWAVDKLINAGIELNLSVGDKHIIVFALSNSVDEELLQRLLDAAQQQEGFLDSLNRNAVEILNRALFDFSKGFTNDTENCEVLKRILDTGIDLEQVDDTRGFTILLTAVSEGALQSVKLLIEYGADIFAVDKEGRTALDLVCSVSHMEDDSLKKELTKVLEKNGLTQTRQEMLEQKVDHILSLPVDEALKALDKESSLLSRSQYERAKMMLLERKTDRTQQELQELLKLYRYHGDNNPAQQASDVVKSLQAIIDSRHREPVEDIHNAFFDLVEKYIDLEDQEENFMFELLQECQERGKWIPLDALQSEVQGSAENQKANKLALELYDALAKFDAVKYLYAKITFLLKIKKRWMDDHFEALIAMLKANAKDPMTLDAAKMLQKEFEKRHVMVSTVETYPVCPVPMEDRFDTLADLYKKLDDYDNAVWFYHYILEEGFGKKQIWHDWIELETKHKDINKVAAVYKQAISKGAQSLKDYWAYEYAQWVCRHGDATGAMVDIMIAGNDKRIKEYRNALMPLVRCGAKISGAITTMGESYLLKILQNLSEDHYDEDFRTLADACKDDLDYVEANYHETLFNLYAATLKDSMQRAPQLLYLKQLGANVNYQHHQTKQNALFDLARSNSVEAITFLIQECGCDSSLKNKDGLSVRDVALQNNAKEVADYLYEKQGVENKPEAQVFVDHQQLLESEIDEAFIAQYRELVSKLEDDQIKDLLQRSRNLFEDTMSKEALEAIAISFNHLEADADYAFEIISLLRFIKIRLEDTEMVTKFLHTINEMAVKSFELDWEHGDQDEMAMILYQNHLPASFMPQPLDCAKKLFDEDESIGELHARYLKWMGEGAAFDLFYENDHKKNDTVEKLIIKRLIQAFGTEYQEWVQRCNHSVAVETLKPLDASKYLVSDLLEVLGSVKTENEEAWQILMYTLSSYESLPKDSAKFALSKVCCQAFSLMADLFDCLQEDFGRMALLEAVEMSDGCSESKQSFLQALKSKDAYIEQKISTLLQEF